MSPPETPQNDEEAKAEEDSRLVMEPEPAGRAEPTETGYEETSTDQNCFTSSLTKISQLIVTSMENFFFW